MDRVGFKFGGDAGYQTALITPSYIYIFYAIILLVTPKVTPC